MNPTNDQGVWVVHLPNSYDPCIAIYPTEAEARQAVIEADEQWPQNRYHHGAEFVPFGKWWARS